MKKLIGAIIIIILLGLGAWLYFGNVFGGAGKTNLARVVPADTLFYAGTSGGRHAIKYTSSIRQASAQFTQGGVDDLTEKASQWGDAGKLLAGMYDLYIEQFAEGKSIPGAGSSPHVVAYGIGLVPVVRVRLTDAAAFKRFVQDAERRAGVHSSPGDFNGAHYRSYSIKHEGKPVKTTLLLAIRQGYAVFTFDTPQFRKTVLPLALGLEKPDTSLADSGLLARVASQNNLSQAYIAFINHKAIAAALTGAPDSRAGKMLAALDDDHELAPLRGPGCQKDLQQITDVWPRTVAGLSAAGGAEAGTVFREKIVSRLTDKSLISQLRKLRGNIPAAILKGQGQPMFSFALGLNVANVGPVVGALQQRFINTDFQCKWLVDAQQSVSDNNPAAKTMAAVMISNVRGVSLAVFDADIAKKTGSVDRKIDALVSIASTHPRRLVQLVKQARPKMFGNLKIPSDGTAVTVLPGRNVKAMIAGQHLIVFEGDKAAKTARQLGQNKITPNGVLYYQLDYRKFARALTKVLNAKEHPRGGDKEKAARMARLKHFMQIMGKQHLQVKTLLDLTEKGVVLDASVGSGEKDQ